MENPRHRARRDALVSQMEVIYRQEGDSIYAWMAFSFCRGRGREIPGWCLDYLDRCADAIDHLANEPTAMSPATKAAEASKVFGFVRPGWNAFERFVFRRESARVAAAHLPFDGRIAFVDFYGPTTHLVARRDSLRAARRASNFSPYWVFLHPFGNPFAPPLLASTALRGIQCLK
jgi:hypothetical protein